MNTASLEIHTTRAELEIVTQKAKVMIRRRRPVLNIVRTKPVMHIDRKLPTMRLNRAQLQRMLYRGPMLQGNLQYFQDALQQGLEAIARIAGEGDQMMAIENGGNAIVQISQQNNTMNTVDINTAALPPPQVEWDMGHFSIDWEPGTLHMKWDVSVWADITIEPHHVEIRMKKHPEISIKVHYKHPEKKHKLDKVI